MPRAVFFDMDRTLVRKNTAQLYVRYQRMIGEAGRRDTLRALWWVLQYTVGVVDAESVAGKAIRELQGFSERDFQARCEIWFRDMVAPHVTHIAKQTVRQHLDAGDMCAIVTGATRYPADPLGRMLDIPHVLATNLETDAHGRFTGNFVRPLCYGEGKIARSEALAKEHGHTLDEAVFYSDSISDLPLLERVKVPVVVNPDPRLRRLARARKWRIEQW
ncbi:MAG: HAD-IB family hydrolase [Myxococcales bacterium]|nr:HAD-IB family hydrolase [Myxococcales bacterium]